MSRRQRWLFGAFTLAVMILTSSYFFARRPTEGGQPIMVSKSECACTLTDPLDPAFALNFGRYAGQCVDNCKYRSVVRLAPKKPGSLRVANIRQADGYWTATIDLAQLDRSEILFQNFTSIVNHVAIGFHFKSEKAIELLPQSGDLSRRQYSRGLVLSAEGAPAKDRTYTLTDGMAGRYAMVYRGSTLEHYQQESVQLGFPLKTYDTDLDLPETRRLLDLTLEYGRRESFQTVYQLIFNNCATTAIDLMRMARDPSEVRLLGFREFLDLERGIPATIDWGTVRRMKDDRYIKTENTDEN